MIENPTVDNGVRDQEFLNHRRMSFITIFNGEFGDLVLEDLAQFCRAEESCFHADPRIHAVLEGRREVYLRIQDHLRLSKSQLWEKYGNGTPTKGE